MDPLTHLGFEIKKFAFETRGIDVFIKMDTLFEL
jgi:hypothetical protein